MTRERREESRKRVVLRRKLLASEEQQSEVARRAGGIDVACELERDRQTTLHVARAEPVNLAVDDPARKIALRRDGVVVRDEHDRAGRSHGDGETKRKASSPA